MPTPTKVKGIKYGTMARYNALATKDPDTLYFITDKGLLYRGESIVVPVNVTTYNRTQTGNDASTEKVSFRVETYGNDPANPSVLTFDVYTKGAIDAIVGVLLRALDDHIVTLATAAQSGHVTLADAIAATPQAAANHVAATPKLVADALAAVQQQIGDLAGALVYKGTLGAAADYSTETEYEVGDYCEYDGGLYRCTRGQRPGEWNANNWIRLDRTVSSLPTTYSRGWTYIVVAPGTYAQKPCEVGDHIIAVNDSPANNNTERPDDWTVVQTNIDGAVTTADTLDSNTLVLGNGGRTVRKLPNFTRNGFLRMGNNGPEWADHINLDHGIATGTSTFPDLGADSTARTADILGFKLVTGAIVAIKFVSGAVAGSTLNISNTGAKAIYWKGAALPANVILNNDTALLINDGTNWNLLALDRWPLWSEITGRPTKLSDFTDDITGHCVCNTASTTVIKEADLTGFTLVTGAIVAVRFTYDVSASSKLNINSTGSKSIYYRGAAIGRGVIYGGDTATFIYDGTYWQLLVLGRPIDDTPTSGSHNLIESNAVYQAIQEATLFWEELPEPETPSGEG